MSEQYPGVIMLEGANRNDKEMNPTILNFLSKVSQIYGKPIQVQCGTNHNQFSLSGNQSDHWLGDAADIYTYANLQGDDTLTGDHIAEAAFVACNVDYATAAKMSKIGALRNFFLNNRRIQIIWRIDNERVGGNHHNHVHIGIRARYKTDPKDGTLQEII